MIRRPPRSTLDRSSAASDVYKRQVLTLVNQNTTLIEALALAGGISEMGKAKKVKLIRCLLYTSPSPRDRTRSRMPSSA